MELARSQDEIALLAAVGHRPWAAQANSVMSFATFVASAPSSVPLPFPSMPLATMNPPCSQFGPGASGVVVTSDDAPLHTKLDAWTSPGWSSPSPFASRPE